jgi:hypothetical protein
MEIRPAPLSYSKSMKKCSPSRPCYTEPFFLPESSPHHEGLTYAARASTAMRGAWRRRWRIGGRRCGGASSRTAKMTSIAYLLPPPVMVGPDVKKVIELVPLRRRGQQGEGCHHQSRVVKVACTRACARGRRVPDLSTTIYSLSTTACRSRSTIC